MSLQLIDTYKFRRYFAFNARNYGICLESVIDMLHLRLENFDLHVYVITDPSNLTVKCREFVTTCHL